MEASQLLNAITAEKGHGCANLALWPAPPLQTLQCLDVLVGETHPDESGGRSDDDAVVRNVTSDNSSCSDHGTVAYRHPRENGRAIADPDIVTDQNIALCTLGACEFLSLSPSWLQHLERPCCGPVRAMVSPKHDRHMPIMVSASAGQSKPSSRDSLPESTWRTNSRCRVDNTARATRFRTRLALLSGGEGPIALEEAAPGKSHLEELEVAPAVLGRKNFTIRIAFSSVLMVMQLATSEISIRQLTRS